VRAVSLSHTRVIELLNRYFVPVYLSNEEYTATGAAPTAEKAELRRILREGHAAGLSVGSVHVYILTPDGRPLDSLHTAEAARPERLIGLLEHSVQRLRPKGGAPVVQPCAPPPPRTGRDTLLLHLTARYLERKGDTLALTGEDAGGNWSALPSEDWISLPRTQCQRLLPARRARVGQTWEIAPEVATTLMTHFYPPTENWDLATHRMQEQVLTGRVVGIQGDRVRARLEGRLWMTHPFYHQPDPNFVEATLVGYLEFDRAKQQIHSLRLVTDEATYRRPGAADLLFGVAVATVPSRVGP
jgi:hypothetical protein